MANVDVRSPGSGLVLGVHWDADAPARLVLRTDAAADSVDAASAQPLVEAIVAGHGRNWSGTRFVTTSIGERLRYRAHGVRRDGAWQTLEVHQHDETTGLTFTSVLSVHDDRLGVRGRTVVRNDSNREVVLYAVSSLVFADFGSDGSSVLDTVGSMSLLRGRNDWLAEGRWERRPLRESGLPLLVSPGIEFRSRGAVGASSVSTWPTAEQLPCAVLRDERTGRGWSYQVEHNGPWLWQVGERADGLYLALYGPTDEQHQWSVALAPGEVFESVPATVALEPAGPVDALVALTEFRRESAAGRDRSGGQVVFNDYMNTVYGDPTAVKLHPLVEAVAGTGADVFVIDAGWYADDDDWWDGVGEWQPSTVRFPDGLDTVLDHIRLRGMTPGLWLEPEVIGLRSPMAYKLPDEAFIRRDGVRVVEHGRYHLDFTSEAARGFLDEVVDRLVNDHGVGYFKFDYNIRAGTGSDTAAGSVGHGLLLHNRAYLDWIASVRRRHPALVLENCASGGMRTDAATLRHFDLQSTSDQEDLHAYAPIAAAAPMLVVPEQSASWAYPQPEMSDTDIEFALATGVLGRLYLSGWVSRMSPRQRQIVAEAVVAHRAIEPRMPYSTPVWPLGLPGWDDEWVCLGLHDRGPGTTEQLHLTVWRRSERPGEVELPLPLAPTGHRWAEPDPVFPRRSELSIVRTTDARRLVVKDEAGVRAAAVVTLRAVRQA